VQSVGIALDGFELPGEYDLNETFSANCKIWGKPHKAAPQAL
jgi:hypothetical protein